MVILFKTMRRQIKKNTGSFKPLCGILKLLYTAILTAHYIVLYIICMNTIEL